MERCDGSRWPDLALGSWDRRRQCGPGPGAFGLTGEAQERHSTTAVCFPDPGSVVVVLANTYERDVDTTAVGSCPPPPVKAARRSRAAMIALVS
jgi:hypothetical protein